MDRVFRTSGLMRKKWDEKHGKETYGQMTIGKAVADCREVYSPPQPDAAGWTPFSRREAPHRPGRHKRYTQDDTGNALRFADTYGERVRYSHTDKCWFVWNGACWQRDETDIVKRLADALLDGMEKELFGLHDEDTVKAFKAHLRRSRSSPGQGGHAEGGAASGRHPRDAEHVRPPQGPFERGKRHGAAAHRRGAGAPPRGLPDAHCPGGIQRRDRLPDVGKVYRRNHRRRRPACTLFAGNGGLYAVGFDAGASASSSSMGTGPTAKAPFWTRWPPCWAIMP